MFASIRDIASQGILFVCRLRGMQVTFVNGGYPLASGVPVLALIESDDIDLGEEEIGYRIPRQTNFPPTEFIPDGKLIISGTETLWIQNVKPDNERIEMSSSILLICNKSADGNFN
jgi:hypothetical protein